MAGRPEVVWNHGGAEVPRDRGPHGRRAGPRRDATGAGWPTSCGRPAPTWAPSPWRARPAASAGRWPAGRRDRWPRRERGRSSVGRPRPPATRARPWPPRGPRARAGSWAAGGPRTTWRWGMRSSGTGIGAGLVVCGVALAGAGAGRRRERVDRPGAVGVLGGRPRASVALPAGGGLPGRAGSRRRPRRRSRPWRWPAAPSPALSGTPLARCAPRPSSGPSRSTRRGARPLTRPRSSAGPAPGRTCAASSSGGRRRRRDTLAG